LPVKKGYIPLLKKYKVLAKSSSGLNHPEGLSYVRIVEIV
jgi:hypothetical protein